MMTTGHISDTARLSAALDGHLPAGTVQEVRVVRNYIDSLFPDERALISGAVKERQWEFSTGRKCARKLLERFGVEAASILPGCNREPQWPSGLHGTITHDHGICIAAVIEVGEIRSLGVDLTSTDPLKPELRDLICAEREHFELSALSYRETDIYKVVFSAKESLYKALYPFVRRYIDFNEVVIDVNNLHRGCWTPIIVNPELAAEMDVYVDGRAFVVNNLITTTAWTGYKTD